MDTAARKTDLALIPIGVALNLSLATMVHAIHAPIYIDMVGTCAVVMLAGARTGVICGVLSFLIGGLLTNPVLPWFTGTQVAVALYVAFAARRGWYRSLGRTIFAGIGLGIVAAIVSAPVIAYLFGGITGAGSSFVTAFFLASGKNLLQSVALSGLACEPLDKTLQTLLMLYLVRGLPSSLIAQFPNSLLSRNNIGRANAVATS